MGARTAVVLLLSVLVVFVESAVSQTNPAAQSQLVVVLKDGSQRTFAMSGVERIEFQTPLIQASNSGLGRFLGEWRVGDCTGRYFHITLERGGLAKKDLGTPNGTWLVMDGEARVTWQDGGRDTIRKIGDTYQKVWYEAGRSYAEEPSCTASAEITERRPI